MDFLTGVGSLFQVSVMDGNFVIKYGLEGRAVAYFSVSGYRTDPSTVLLCDFDQFLSSLSYLEFFSLNCKIFNILWTLIPDSLYFLQSPTHIYTV